MKSFKSIDDQYNLLISRGLSFEDEVKAKCFLLNHNYYNIINCYAKFFMDETNHFHKGTTFEEISNVHFFDKEIKSVLFKSIMEIEVHFKSIISHRFSEKFQSQDYPYLIASNYNMNKIICVTKTISLMSGIIDKYKNKKSNAINHYINKHKHVPLWILINYMNFGCALHFFNYLDESLKNQISKDFSHFLAENLGLEHIHLTSDKLYSFLCNVLDIRNIIAHNNKLLGFKCKGHIHYMPQLHDTYSITHDSEKQDVYHVFIAMQALLSKNQYANLHNTLLKRMNYLQRNLKTIDINVILSCLGFPSDWHKTPKLKQ